MALWFFDRFSGRRGVVARTGLFYNPRPVKTRTLGTFAAVVAAVSYGTNPLWAHYLHAEGVSTHSMLAGRFVLAALVLGAWSAAARRSLRVGVRELGTLVVLGCLFGASALGLFSSFRHMDSGLACTLLFVYPVMVALLMAALSRERAGWRVRAALVVALPGVALLTRPGGGAAFSWTGFWLVMWSSATYAVYMVVVNVSRAGRLSATTLSFWSFVFCAVFVALHGFASGTPPSLPPTESAWFHLLGLALVPTIGSLVAMAVAISRIGSTRTALLGSLEPVTAVVVGTMLFGEPFTIRHAAGIGLVLLSVAGVVSREKGTDRA